jgi:hypothetical protein
MKQNYWKRPVVFGRVKLEVKYCIIPPKFRIRTTVIEGEAPLSNQYPQKNEMNTLPLGHKMVLQID